MTTEDTQEQIKNELKSVFNQYLQAYFQERDLAKIRAMLHPEMTGIGTAADENAIDLDSALQLFERDIAQAPQPFSVTIHALHADVIDTSTGLIYAVLSASSGSNEILWALINVRLSILLIRRDGKWLIRHLHFSEPSADTDTGKSYPASKLAAYNEILARMVQEKTLQLREQSEALKRELDERSNIEKTLREAEETFSSIITSSPMGIYLYEVAADGRLILRGANPAADRMVRVDHSTLLGKPIEDAFPALANTEIPTRFTEAALHSKSWFAEQVVYQSAEITGIFEVYAFGIGHKKAAVMFTEISERKKAEAERLKLHEQLNQTQKMESIGRLAGGVAHDFNNMLGVIMGHAEMALEQTTTSATVYEDLLSIKEAASHSSDLTRQLLAFARKQTVYPRVLDINATVAGMLKMLSRLIGESIVLTWEPSASPVYVKMDPGQIDQILANLCVNARDAMTSAGKICIRTDSADVQKTLSGSHGDIPAGRYALLIVEDNGCGIETGIIKDIFDPFFTTKATGKNTKLKLSTVFGIVSQNHGYISVDTKPGYGTVFTLFLPRVTQAEETQELALPQTRQEGNETILVAEDNTAILKITTAILRKHGYRVIPASTPMEAIRAAEAETNGIDLLLSDIVMPVMNGRELAERILRIHPSIKTLYMSGYPEDIVAKHGTIENGIHFISKPFSIDAIIAKIRQILDLPSLPRQP